MNENGAGRHKKKTVAETVPVPFSLLHTTSGAALGLEASQDKLQDCLLSRDPAFVQQMHKARAHHRYRETRPLEDLKRELCAE